MGRPIIKIKLSEEERVELERRVRSVAISKRDSLRAGIILLRAEGKSQEEVSKECEEYGQGGGYIPAQCTSDLEEEQSEAAFGKDI